MPLQCRFQTQLLTARCVSLCFIMSHPRRCKVACWRRSRESCGQAASSQARTAGIAFLSAFFTCSIRCSWSIPPLFRLASRPPASRIFKWIQIPMHSDFAHGRTRILHNPTDHKSGTSRKDRNCGHPSKYVESKAIDAFSHDCLVICDEHDQQHQRWSREALHDSCPHEGLHWVNSKEIHAHCHQRKNRNSHIESFGLNRWLIQAVLPPQGLTKIIRGAAGHHRNCQEPHSDNSERE